MKTCTRCKELKPLQDFYRLSASKDGHRTQCKTCSDNYKNNKKIGIIEPLKEPQKFLFENNVCKIEINSVKHGLQYALIDLEDYNRIKEYTWGLEKKGYVLSSTKKVNGKQTYLHRYIMNCPEDKIVDHINHDPLDNRKQNLRVCTTKDNVRNQRKFKEGRTSIYKGVYLNSINRWQAQIKVRPKTIYLGLYEDEIEAAKAYNEAAVKYFGEFACLNEIPHV